MTDSLQPHGLQLARLLCPWDFPGKNTGVGCHFLLQGTFPIQVSNPHLLCLLHWLFTTGPPGRPFREIPPLKRVVSLERKAVFSGLSLYLLYHLTTATAAAKSLQSCPTLCHPIDGSPPGSPVPGILQARILEWVAIFFSNAWKWKVKVKSLSRLLATHGLQPTRPLHPWDFPGKSTGVGCHCLLCHLTTCSPKSMISFKMVYAKNALWLKFLLKILTFLTWIFKHT